LLVDDLINPRVYLETKAPGELDNKAKLETFESKARRMAERYPTIEQVVLSDVKTWVIIDLRRHQRVTARLDSTGPKWADLFMNLRACDYR
jgi:hypothetical protein